MDTLDIFARELAAYTGIDSNPEDIRAYLQDLIGIDDDAISYGGSLDSERSWGMDP